MNEKQQSVIQQEDSDAVLEKFANREYKEGFVTQIEQEIFEPGLNEDVIRRLSEKKGEPDWMLEWRLKAFRHLQTMSEPTWPNVQYSPVDLQSISY